MLMLPARETPMQYRTIILKLLQQRPQLYEQLCKEHNLLITIKICAKELRERHDAWKERLLQTRPGSTASQIDSEALEMAVTELEDRMPPEPMTNQ